MTRVAERHRCSALAGEGSGRYSGDVPGGPGVTVKKGMRNMAMTDDLTGGVSEAEEPRLCWCGKGYRGHDAAHDAEADAIGAAETAENEAATKAGHLEACWYTIKATLAERVVHYATRLPACDGFDPAPAPPTAGYLADGTPVSTDPAVVLLAIRKIMLEMGDPNYTSMEKALDEISDQLSPPYEAYEDALDTAISEHQWGWIKEHHGEKAAGNTNYGWGVDASTPTISYSSKVYGLGVLTTTASKIGEYADEWSDA